MSVAVSSVKVADHSEAGAPRAVPTGERVDRFDGISRFMQELEVGQRALVGAIQSAPSGERLSNAELLALQASMTRYTQALELVSRLVGIGGRTTRTATAR
ncbi:hypothetical protein LXT21_28745 [Myxococcus sp. K38C18041901]|uniref:hypothetical protein n=1 Tax=Myxococcus guangdongensis TaxID=2906760 RepID=UPI0020A80F09|nr:hypothetical protein [Myxococcus guangdongensis]MCP3062781.1 hypothetical protein [Myxococcus guangdongensis]